MSVQTGLRLGLGAAACVIALGVFLRLGYLDRRVYTFDEVMTALRVSGYTFTDYQKLVLNREQPIEHLQRFQGPNRTPGPLGTVRSLEAEDPQHPPLYYLLQRWWTLHTGNTIVDRRLLSAIASTLAIPLFALLVWQLTRDRVATLVGTTLFAVSPFQIAFAQQAREYALWTFLTLLASIVLVRAVRVSSAFLWTMYGVAAVFALYCFPLFLFVIAGHAIYVGVQRRRDPKVGLRPFLVAAFVAVAAYGPWIAVLAGHHATVASTTEWLALPYPAVIFSYKWLYNICSQYFDLSYIDIWLSLLFLPILLLIALALGSHFRRTPSDVDVFVLSLISAAVLPLLAYDAIFRHSYSTAGRYFIPAWLALQVSVAAYLGRWLRLHAGTRAIPAVLATICLIAGALTSAIVGARSESWPTANVPGDPLPDLAAKITQPNALIMTSDYLLALELSNYLAKTKPIYVGTSSTATTSELCRVRYLLNPNPGFRAVFGRLCAPRIALLYEAEAASAFARANHGVGLASQNALTKERRNVGIGKRMFLLYRLEPPAPSLMHDEALR